MDTKNTKLIFFYNADSGLFNSLTDTAHKLFSPQTYACNLCAITYSSFGMKKEWKDYINGLKIEKEFLHKNEFQKKYNMKNIKLPAIFIEKDGISKLLIDEKSINSCKEINDLIELIDNKLIEVLV